MHMRVNASASSGAPYRQDLVSECEFAWVGIVPCIHIFDFHYIKIRQHKQGLDNLLFWPKRRLEQTLNRTIIDLTIFSIQHVFTTDIIYIRNKFGDHLVETTIKKRTHYIWFL